jgi:hypothetical protein
MRTTIDIPDAVYQVLKAKALRENRSIKELVLRGVEVELRSNAKKRGKRVSLPLVRSKRPGSLKVDNVKIYDLISFP